MTTPRPIPFPATALRARVFTPFVIILDSDDEIITLPIIPALPSPDHTPPLYGYPLDSSDDSSNEDLSETVELLHTQSASTSIFHLPHDPYLLALSLQSTRKGDPDATRLQSSHELMESCTIIHLVSTTFIRVTILIL
nr:hypothetical protein [Tanacetum cinerariifolium]